MTWDKFIGMIISKDEVFLLS